MKKKLSLIFGLLFVALFASGCSANYTLKYEDDTFTEILEVTGEEEDEAHPTYASIKENGLYADIDGTEMFELDPASSRYDVKLTHELNQVKLKDLKAVTECFSLSNYIENDTSIYFSLHGEFTCTYLEDSTFTLETDAEVFSHNAHEVKNNKYIWNLDEDELDEEGIKFQILRTEKDTSLLNSDSMFPIWLKILFLVIILGVGIGLIYIAKKSTER